MRHAQKYRQRSSKNCCIIRLILSWHRFAASDCGCFCLNRQMSKLSLIHSSLYSIWETMSVHWSIKKFCSRKITISTLLSPLFLFPISLLLSKVFLRNYVLCEVRVIKLYFINVLHHYIFRSVNASHSDQLGILSFFVLDWPAMQFLRVAEKPEHFFYSLLNPRTILQAPYFRI